MADLVDLRASNKLNIDQVKALKKTCQLFYVERAKQIRERFRFDGFHASVLKYCGFISSTNLNDIRSIAPVARFFKVDEVTVDNEYRLFRNI